MMLRGPGHFMHFVESEANFLLLCGKCCLHLLKVPGILHPELIQVWSQQNRWQDYHFPMSPWLWGPNNSKQGLVLASVSIFLLCFFSWLWVNATSLFLSDSSPSLERLRLNGATSPSLLGFELEFSLRVALFPPSLSWHCHCGTWPQKVQVRWPAAFSRGHRWRGQKPNWRPTSKDMATGLSAGGTGSPWFPTLLLFQSFSADRALLPVGANFKPFSRSIFLNCFLEM